MCTTFAERAGILRLIGGVPATADGMVMTIASSQGGRNAFVAQGQKTAEGLSGAWEGIRECEGSFSAVRVLDAEPAAS